VTKSVVSALIGAAIADGWIGGIDDPVTKYIPEMQDPRFTRVTLRHLLDNTAGIKYERGNMPWASQPRMYYTTDVRGYVRGVGIDVEPGVRFSTEDLSPIILGWVLERALRRHPAAPTLSNYLAERIWQPIGAEYDAIWIVDREQGGLEKGESGLTARAIDLAKFAALYLQQGRWASRQVIPAAWVSESTSVNSDPPGPNVWSSGFFKHQWWVRKVPAPASSDFYANGHFGQRLYVSPRNQLILVRMGDSNRGIDWADFPAVVADAFVLGPKTGE
jgi:CubicO group peptidase (beta-lactamase class C family)